MNLVNPGGDPFSAPVEGFSGDNQFAVGQNEFTFSQDRDIFVGTCVVRGDKLFLTPKRILKGNLQIAVEYQVNPVVSEPFLASEMFREHAADEFVFVGVYDKEQKILQAMYGKSSFWPWGVAESNLPSRTVAECETFVKETLAAQKKAGERFY